MSKKEKATREYLQTLTKDRVIELCLQFMFDVEVTEQQLAEKDKEIADLEKENGILTNLLATKPSEIELDELYTQLKQLEEKDKEIAHLKDGLDMCKNIKRYDIGEMLTENIKLKQNQTQLAIQELEKVKIELRAKLHLLDSSKFGYLRHFVAWHDICDQINKQIKELSGGRDGKF